MSVAEAQACGTPVAGYEVGGVKEAVWDGDADNFMPVQQTEALLAVVQRVLAGDPSSKEKAVARAAWVAGRFSSAVVGAAQAAVYAGHHDSTARKDTL